MEYWNDGLRGRKRIYLFLPFSIPTIPLFQYSIIPWVKVKPIMISRDNPLRWKGRS